MSSSDNGETLDDDENILEGTLALIKPDAVNKAKEIINIIISEGFLVVEKKKFQFSREVRGRSLMTSHEFQKFFDQCVKNDNPLPHVPKPIHV